MQEYTNQSGRSMTEMLGVLAVIGVLSIGGIQGYTYAMNKYRANNVLNEMNIASLHLATTLLSSRNAQKMIALGEPYDSGTLTHEAYPFNYGCGNCNSEERACHQEETGYWTKISDVPEKVCQQILSEAKHLPNIVEQQLNGVAVEDGVDCEDNNEIMLLFNADGSGKLAKNCDQSPVLNCPTNTSKNGQGGLAKTLTDETTGIQVKCYCVKRDTAYNETTGKCEALTGTCSSNAQCNRGEYCDITNYGTNYCTKNTSGMKGTCKLPTLKTPKSNTNPPFVVSSAQMYWWSANHFCQALDKTLVEVSDYACAHTICPSGCNAKIGYCHVDTSMSVTASSTSNISAIVRAMKLAYGSSYNWMNTDYTSCNAYIIYTYQGYIHNNLRYDRRFAVCK